jgi:hypothetical protein
MEHVPAMVEELNISYEPFKEIVIMEYMKFKSPDDLARFLNIASGGKPTGVYWTSGVAFFYYPMSTSTETATKTLIEEKKVYWAFVGYALMPDYRLIIETKEKIMIPVIDMSSNSLFMKAAMWLKERKEEVR